jgi:ketosteroid isomerase-like protein
VSPSNARILLSALAELPEAQELEAEEVHEAGGEVVVVGRPEGDLAGERVAWRATIVDGKLVSGPTRAAPGDALRQAGIADSTGHNVELVRRHYAAYNQADASALLATLHPEVEILVRDERAGGRPESYRSREEAAGFFAGIWELVADSRVEILSLDATPERVEASLRLSGRVKSTGETGSVPAVHFFAIADDLIARIETYRPDWRAAIAGDEAGERGGTQSEGG